MNKKNIIITGALGRIGKALLKNFSKMKYNVILSDVVKPKKNFALGNNVSFVKLDLTKEKNIKKLISFSLKKLKKIDAVIHCSYPKTKNWGIDLQSLDLKSLEMRFNEISNNTKFSEEDTTYIEKEFNNLLLEDGYRSFLDYLKLKEFIKLIFSEIN